MKKTKITIIVAIPALLILTILLGIFIAWNNLIERQTFVRMGYYLTMIAIFALSLLTIIEFISIFFDKDASRSTIILSVALLVFLLTSYDGLYLFFGDGLNQGLGIFFMNVNYFSIIVSVLSFLYLLRRDYNIVQPKIEKNLTYIGISVLMVLNIVLSIFGLQIVNTFITYSTFILVCGRYMSSIFLNKTVKSSLISTFIIIYLLFDMYLALSLGFTFPKYFISYSLCGLYSILIFLNFLNIYFRFIVSKTNEAYKKEELEKELNILNSHILKNQIDPHYIFNSLNLIKSSYLVDKEKGEKVLDLFSKQMRAIVESKDVYLAELNKELEVLLCYIELENIRIDKEIRVIFDIDIDDFEVPYFSIQPLVENAIKYSGVTNKEDGYIKISTTEDDKNYIMTIIDNGNGFDPDKVSVKSYGIKNIKERFKLLLNADMIISSILGIGTTITITIPKKKEVATK